MRICVYAIVMLFTLICCWSCSHKGYPHSEEKPKHIPFSIDCDQLTIIEEVGLDSQVGMITCDDLTLKYDYGLYAPIGPKTLRDYFTKSFYAVHYDRLFNKLNIDQRLRESFKDSVDIIDVVNTPADDPIIPCEGCLSYAILRFKNADLQFPFQGPKSYESIYQSYEISFEDEGHYIKKIYLAKDHTLVSGAYVYSKGRPNKHNSSSALSITSDSRDTATLHQILLSISLR